MHYLVRKNKICKIQQRSLDYHIMGQQPQQELQKEHQRSPLVLVGNSLHKHTFLIIKKLQIIHNFRKTLLPGIDHQDNSQIRRRMLETKRTTP